MRVDKLIKIVWTLPLRHVRSYHMVIRVNLKCMCRFYYCAELSYDYKSQSKMHV